MRAFALATVVVSLVASPSLALDPRFPVEVDVDSLNVRAGPWGTVIDRAPRGLVLITRGQRDGFVQVDWADRLGWVHASYVRRTTTPAVEVTASSLNVRVGPSTSNAAFGMARAGSAFAKLSTAGDWVRIQFGPRAGWVHGAYLRPIAMNAPRRPAPAPGGRGWQAVHRGLTLDGGQVPRKGLANATLRRALGVAVEPIGDEVAHDGRAFVRGTVSWFGGRSDTGVSATETGAITGENLRALNGGAAGPRDDHRAQHPEDYYYVAMRFDYSPKPRAWWRDARILVVSPTTGRAVVVRPVDWGPHTRTGRLIDLSPQSLRDLGISTDAAALVSFAAPGTPLGPVR